MKYWSLLLLLCPLAAQAAPTLVKQAEPGQDELVIPYKLYRLDNGLTVILNPDKSDPLAHVEVTYHVGSAREQPDQTGFAHFFEHMMFQGSKHVGDQEHFRLINEAGGTMNGTTNQDRTNYFETVPANHLEKVLWLEADRMGFLLEAVSQHKFEIQRDTVKNERAQRIDNQPYGLVGERMDELLYPRDHPYSWPTIGYVEDLDRVDVNDLKAFFLRWYGPNNATLVISGDFDTEQTLQWVDKYFSPIPAGPEVERAKPAPALLKQNRHQTLEDSRIRMPMLYMSYPTVWLGNEDEAALDVLANVLGGGKNSLLYQELVETGKAVSAGAGHYCSELACNFNIWAYANPSQNGNLAPLKEDIERIINTITARGIEADDVSKAVSELRADLILGLDSAQGKARQLSLGQVLRDDPLYAINAWRQLADTSPDEVKAAYQRYLKNKPHALLSVVPTGKTEWQAAEPDYMTPERDLPEHQQIDDLPLRTVTDEFDRSRMPEPGKPVTTTVPPLWQETIGDNIELLGTVNSEIPAVSIIFALPGGQHAEAEGEAGLSALTAAMMNQGTEQLSNGDFSEALERLGASLNVRNGFYTNLIEVTTLTDTLPDTLKLVEELLFHPGFRSSDFEKVKSRMLESMAQSRNQPSWLARQGFKELMYGNSRLGLPDDGMPENIENFTLEQVKAFYQRYYNPRNGHVIIAGDLTPEQAKRDVAFLTRWQGEAPVLPAVKVPEQPAEPGIYVIDMPGAVQSVVRVGRRALPVDATGPYFYGQLMNYNLGGNFNSRINLNLREDKGYTYGAYSYFSGNRDAGVFAVAGDVRGDATAEALQEILEEMTLFAAKGPTAEELAYLKSSYSQQDALSYETLGKKAGFLLNLAMLELSPDYLTKQQQIVANVDAATLTEQAKKWLDPTKMVIVVAGDKAKLEKSLAQLNLPIHDLTIE
ncbi:insulinase family protein [Oceanimonas baumannii]|uniref:M16 family metallopeptidase n=1 Tax=Oceanimonas baumannii TaxID=129578 RepID=UPI001D193DE7|nr:pitrilysin family protein [Oceanimonas baumannii]MCC4265725.1 insulinase family protein [Oceanimonas baumannii]